MDLGYVIWIRHMCNRTYWRKLRLAIEVDAASLGAGD